MDDITSNKNSFGVFLGEPSSEQLNQFFYLHENDLELINNIRRPATKLDLAIQLVSLRFLGTFLPDIHDIPKNVLNYVAVQLKVVLQVLFFHVF